MNAIQCWFKVRRLAARELAAHGIKAHERIEKQWRALPEGPQRDFLHAVLNEIERQKGDELYDKAKPIDLDTP